jgi:hypothetical protein
MPPPLRTPAQYTAKESGLVVSFPAGALPDPTHAAVASTTQLYLGSAGIQALRGLQPFACLETLYLNNNALTTLDGIEDNFRLRHLFARDNLISRIGALDDCRFLEEIDLSDNRVSYLDTVVDLLRPFDRLRILLLKGNPVSQEPGYRPRLIAALPSLEILDNLLVDPDERRRALAAAANERGSRGAAIGASSALSGRASAAGTFSRPASRAVSSSAGAQRGASRASGTGSLAGTRDDSGANSGPREPSALVRALEREAAQIRERRLLRAQAELTATFDRSIDPEWEAAAAATRALGSSHTEREGETGARGSSMLEALGLRLPSALSSTIAAEAARTEQLGHRAVRAALQRRNVPLLPADYSDDGTDLFDDACHTGTGDPAAAPRSEHAAARLKSALVASVLPPPLARAGPLGGLRASIGAWMTASQAAASGGGLLLGSDRAEAALRGTGSAAAGGAGASATLARPSGGGLPASLSRGLLPPSQGGLAGGRGSVGGSAEAGSSARGGLLPAVSPLRPHTAAQRPRVRGDPAAQFIGAVTGKVERLLAVERGLEADAAGARGVGGAAAASDPRLAGSDGSTGAASAGEPAAPAAWDRFRVQRAFAEFLTGLALQAAAMPGGGGGATGGGPAPEAAAAGAQAATPTAAPPAAATVSPRPTTAGGSAAGSRAAAAAQAAAAVAPAAAAPLQAPRLQATLTPPQLQAALLSCKDFGLCPEPEPPAAASGGNRSASLGAASVSGSVAGDASGSSSGSGGARRGVREAEGLGAYVLEVTRAMGYEGPSAAVPWQAFLAAAQSGSFTRSSSSSGSGASGSVGSGGGAGAGANMAGVASAAAGGAGVAGAAAGGAGVVGSSSSSSGGSGSTGAGTSREASASDRRGSVGAGAPPGAAVAAAASIGSAAPAPSAGPSIVRVRRLRWRPITQTEASQRATAHFKRAAEALRALERLSGSDAGALGPALRHTIASATERGNRLSDLAAALGGAFDPPPQRPAPARPRTDAYTFRTLLPEGPAARRLAARAAFAGGALGWADPLPLPGEESDDDEEEAVALLLRAQRAREVGGDASGGLDGSRGATDRDEAAVAQLHQAMQSETWGRYRQKQRARGPHTMLTTALSL